MLAYVTICFALSINYTFCSFCFFRFVENATKNSCRNQPSELKIENENREDELQIMF